MKFEDLVVGQFNELAVKASEMVMDSSERDYPVLIIQGGFGSGKSSLVKAIESNAVGPLTVKSWTGTNFMNEMIQAMRDHTYADFFKTLESLDILVIEDLQELSNRTGTQHTIHKAIKYRVANKKQTIITTSMPIDTIDGISQELGSFLKSSLVVEIHGPSFEDKLLITKHIANSRNLSLYDDIAKLIAETCKNNIRAIEGAILKLEAGSKILKKSITLEFAKEVLKSNDILRHRNQSDGLDEQYFARTARSIEEKLKEFRLNVQVINVLKGPVVDTFEVELGDGVKVSSVTNRSDDLSLALMGAPIRLIYPMKDKSTIGMEVPRNPRDVINLDSILESKSFVNSTHQLPIVLGKDTFGDDVINDLASLPHLLIAGTTGAGNSMFINSLIYSLIKSVSSEKLKMILIDPKQLSFMVFKNIPHLLAPIICDPFESKYALNWVIEEMERRNSLFEKYGVKNITKFNQAAKDDVKQGLSELQRIVIVIDELADLVLSKLGRSIENSIIRISAKARVLGIHLVIATQRPSTDVITGAIKANFPSRVAFRVFTNIDSRVILDGMGAEKLLGKGDMLFKHGIDLQRLHAPYINEDKLEEYIGQLKGIPTYDTGLMVAIQDGHSTEDENEIDSRIDENERLKD